MEYPHLFFTTSDDNCDNRTYWVMIAHSTFSPADITDLDLQGHTCGFFPNIDLVRSTRSFDSEGDALEYVRQWWIESTMSYLF